MISEKPAGDSNLEALQAENRKLRVTLAKRDWLLDVIESHRSLSTKSHVIERRVDLSSGEFFERYYAQNRPVVLAGELSHWPAVLEWSPDVLKAKIGSLPVQFQGDRDTDRNHELVKDAHSRELPFDQFIDLITSKDASNNAYLTAYNSERVEHAMSKLSPDLGTLDRFLDHKQQHPNGMMWIGPRASARPLCAQTDGSEECAQTAAADPEQTLARRRLKVGRSPGAAHIHLCRPA
ncbi:MAG: hypothetical protein QOD94_2073 [Alphaproteobacteria bacterium]|nr:hypothetical protein [Alphaproteobacteria bacterium]